MVGKYLNIDILTALLDRLSVQRTYILLLASGLFSALSFAPFYFFPSFMISLPVLLLLTQRSENASRAFWSGYAFGFGHFFAGLYWIGNSFAAEPSLPHWAGFVMVAVLAAYLSLFVALVGYGVWHFHNRQNIRENLIHVVLTFVILWVVCEWLRGNLFTGFPWNLSGYIFGFSDIMLQSTSVWGIYGLGIIVLLLMFVPLLTFERRWRLSAPITGLAVIVSLYVFGNQRLPDNIDYVEDVNLRIVQANIQQVDKWPVRNWGKNLVSYMDMSETTTDEEPVHVIWPETAVIYALSDENLRRQLISRILPEAGGTVLTGFPRRERTSEGRKVYNSFIAIDEQGGVGGIYDKSHLVPFGEYIPAFIRSTAMSLGLDQLFSGGQDFSHGEGLSTLKLDGLPPVGVLICYEVIFPGQVVDQNDRPDWLLNITNDAWYGDSTGPYQHLLQTRVRSIEEGLPMVRSAGTGISAMIDPYGRVINKVPLNKKAVINSELPAKIETGTIYSQLKEWTFACIVAILIIANSVLYRRNQTSKR